MTSPLADLTGDFVTTCTIQAATKTQDDYGQEIETWDTLPGHSDLNCVLGRGDGSTKGEIVKDNMTLTLTPLKVTLLDSYPGITTAHRCLIGTTAYNIVDTWIDQLGYHTVLQVVAVC